MIRRRRFRPNLILTCALLAVAFAAIWHRSAYAAAAKSSASPSTAAPKPSAEIEPAPAPKAIDYDKLTNEAVDFLSKYIKINTSNPPGHEIDAAKMLRQKFLADGIPVNVWEAQPDRGIIAARLRGTPHKQKSLILLSHMDVVPAEAKDWQTQPFSGEVKDGYVWGRGAVDDKGPAVIEMMAMLAIKRAGVLLDRDVLFVATGDEEEGGHNGAEWFTEHERDIFSDAGYLLNEGGAIRDFPNGKKLYEVSTTEKTAMWLHIVAEGQAGHAAAPPPETSVTRLVRALARLIDYRSPIRVIGPVQQEFHVLAELGQGPSQWLDLDSSIHDAAFARQFLAVPSQNAKVRNTIAPTVLSGSQKTNVIPPIAYADVDCRLLPGEDSKQFLKTIKKVIGDDSVRVEVKLNFPPASSPSKSTLMTAIEKLARDYDKAQVTPVMIGGFTDSRYFRQKDVVAYGFIPLEAGKEEFEGVHGVDERIQIKHLGDAIHRMVDLLEQFGGVRKAP